MFSPPHEVHEAADLEEAFSTVAAELQGSPEVPQRLHARRGEFLQMLGDPRKAGQWVAQTLDGLEWDWPRWCDYVRMNELSNATVPQLRAQASEMQPAEALDMLTTSQLKELLREHGGKVQAKTKKTDLLQAVQALPNEAWEPVCHTLIQQWLEYELLICHQEMGRWLALRIHSIAMAQTRLRQLSDPELLARRPHWEFVCAQPEWPPKPCKKLHGKQLSAAEAIKAFPALPCERLNCACRIVAKQ